MAITVPRAISGGVGDYGFFTGVADRLVAGDALYAGVWDNKDPLVFYAIAVARFGGVPGAWLLEVAWVALACLAVFLIARRAGLESIVAAVVAWVLAPLVILGMPYFMGSTHLPGVALVLLAIALALGRRPWLAGIPLGLLVFFKFVMVPLAIAVLVIALLRPTARRQILRVALAAVATIAVIAGIMALRGELTGFLGTQLDNILYSQSPIVSAEYTSLAQKIAQHLVILVNPHIALVLLATAVIVVVGAVAPSRRTGERGWRAWATQSTLWWVAVGAFLVSVATIAVTGKWFHHAEILAVPSALALVLLVQSMRIEWRRSTALTLACTALAVVPLSAAPGIDWYLSPFRTLGPAWQEANSPDPLTRLLEERAPTTVAFVGQGNLVPRSGGLTDWQLACRHIGQRPFNPTWLFDETLDCLPSAELIVVTNDYGRDPAFPDYTAFVDGVEHLLVREYVCEEVPDFRLCQRRR